MLELCKASLQRGTQLALADIDFELAPGEMVGILGGNGAGKSSLLAVLAGELPPDAGRAMLDKRPLDELKPQELARRRALLPQAQPLPFELSVAEIVAMGAYPWPECPPHEITALTRQALDAVDAGKLHQRLYPTLSGGEAQRVQFARTLLQLRAAPVDTPRYLLLDEPTAHLDPRHQHQLLQAAHALAHKDGIGVAVVLHDINLAARWCDRLALLKDGQLVACGPTAEVLTQSNLEATFDCPARLLPHPDHPERPLILLGAD